MAQGVEAVLPGRLPHASAVCAASPVIDTQSVKTSTHVPPEQPGKPAWMPMLALSDRAKLWETRRLRVRLLSTAGQLVTTGRRRIFRLARHRPWTGEITAALERLALPPDPG